MTSWPIEENSFSWWLTCGKWRRLHAIPGGSVSPERLRDAVDWNEPVHTRAACGLRRGWLLPGMGSRLGGRRCGACCSSLGIPGGWGTPANETTEEPE